MIIGVDVFLTKLVEFSNTSNFKNNFVALENYRMGEIRKVVESDSY